MTQCKPPAATKRLLQSRTMVRHHATSSQLEKKLQLKTLNGLPVDSNSFLDVFLDDPSRAERCESAWAEYGLDANLPINSIVYAEGTVSDNSNH
jgi:esterase/lipase superfamily enzyme